MSKQRYWTGMESTHLVLVNSLVWERSNWVRIHHNFYLFAGGVVPNATLNLSLLSGTLEKRVSKLIMYV